MKREELMGHGAIFGANFLWGVMSPITKLVFAGGIITPFILVGLRMGGAAILFWLFALLTGYEKVEKRDILLFFVASLLGVICNQGVYTIGLSMTSPVDASVISTSTPIFTMVIAALYLREPMTAKKVGGVLLGAVGAVMLVLSGVENGAGLGGSALGDGLCIFAELCFASYLVFFKALISRYSPMTVMRWMFTWSTLIALPFTWNDITSVDYASLDTPTLAGLAYIVVVATFVCYFLSPIGQKYLRPTVVSMYFYVQPVVATILATILGSAGTFGIVKIISVIMIFSGVFLVMNSKSRADVEKEAKR